MRTYSDAEAAWQRARDLAAAGDIHGAVELVIEVVWAVLDDFQLGPGEHGRLQRLLAG